MPKNAPNAPSLNDLLPTPFDQSKRDDFMAEVMRWLEEEDGCLFLAEAERLGMLLPEGIRTQVAYNGTSLKTYFKDKLDYFLGNIAGRIQVYTDKIEELKKVLYEDADDTKVYGRLIHWSKLRDDFMKQFLINQLSQAGMIPTYSFPTHSICLNVSTQKSDYQLPWDSQVQLNRDASLGISEYAPGAEVIADGRLWRSSGIERMPKDFMPTRYFSECKDCHFVTIREDKADLPNLCSNCQANIGYRGKTQAFIEPKFFVTAYEGVVGKAPGATRIREKPADEARLITLPPEAAFELTDHPLIHSVLLPAFTTERLERGEMFIVNRGPHKKGYRRCAFCGYAEPFKGESKQGKGKKATKQEKHLNPRDGMDCRSTFLLPAENLAHIFYTDVRQFKFRRELPPCPAKELNSVHFRESFALTLCEALRYAASELLNVPDGELRCTYRLRSQYVDVILYDGVPGGAGYCKELTSSSCSMASLLRRALRKLQCSQNCSSSCRACLNDYRNQLIWDFLDRHLVQAWLAGLIQEQEAPLPFGGVHISRKMSNAYLSQRLEKAHTIHFVTRTLDSIENERTEELDWLIDMLNKRKKVFVHFTMEPKFNARGGVRLRYIYRYLMPYLNDQLLTFSVMTSSWDAMLSHPRIFSGSQPGDMLWTCEDSSVPLLESLAPKPVYEFQVNEALAVPLAELISKSTPLDPNELHKDLAPSARWSYAAGEPRNLTDCFRHLQAGTIEEMRITDAYCISSERQRQQLADFLTCIQALTKAIKKLHIIFSKWDRDENPNQIKLVTRRQLMNQLGHDRVTVELRTKRTGGAFHDREIKIILVSDEGLSRELAYDLTGGIDLLMSPEKETKVSYLDLGES